MQPLRLACVILGVSLGSACSAAQTVTLNFASASGACVDATAYLKSFGITFASIAGSSVQICGAQPDVFSGFFFIGPPITNIPVSGDLIFSSPVSQITIVTSAVNSATSTPAWDAIAYNASGTRLSSVGEGAIFPGPGAISLPMNVSGVTRLHFDAFNTGGNTYNFPPIAAITFTTSALPLSIITSTLPSIGAGLAYNAPLAATGGTGTGYTWCVLDGSTCDPNPASPAALPAGFTLSPAGLISALNGNAASPGTYPFTVQVADSGGKTATAPLSLTISCQSSTILSTFSSGQANGVFNPYELASFTPPPIMNNLNPTLVQYASACGFDNFNWQQQITHEPAGGTVIPRDPALVPANVSPLNCSSVPAANWPLSLCSLVAPPSYYDPPPGGYTYFFDPMYNPYPFVYPNSTSFSPGRSCTILLPHAGICDPVFPTVVSLDGSTLSFVDDPAELNLSGLPPAPIQPPGTNFMEFATSLVGVSSSPSSGNVSCGPGSTYFCTTLYTWVWNSTFNGKAGGTSQTASAYGIDPGSGTGGVAVSSINGVPSPAIALDPSAGTINFGTPLSVAATVTQFNGQPVPAGTITLSSGAYTSAATTLDGNGGATIIIPAGSLPIGPDVLTAKYAPSAPVSASYSQGWGTAVVTVNAVTAQVTFVPNPSTQTYGTPITAGSLDAIAQSNGSPVNGTFVYTTGGCGGGGQILTAGTSVLAAGSYSITACFTPSQANHAATSATAQYNVTYGVCLLYDPTKAVQSGSTIPLKIQLCDAKNADASNSSVVVHGVSLLQTGTNASSVLQASGNANPDNDFRFDPTLGPTGGYIFNLSTKGLTTGSYQLTFTAGGDPVRHVLAFHVR